MPAAPLSAADLERFRATGLVRLRRAFAPEDAARMRALLWRRLGERFGAREGQPATWNENWRGLARYGSDPAFRAIATPRLRMAIDQILGPGNWLVPKRWNMFLVNPPKPTGDAAPWSVPSAGWHADGYPHARSSINVFVFYGAVAPHGGGTLLVEGSHRLIARLAAGRSPREIAPSHGALWSASGFLTVEPFIARLLGAAPRRAAHGLSLMRRQRSLGGEDLREIEATGDPGDVIIWHDWMLHVRPSHHQGAPRLMTNRNIRLLGPAGLVEALGPNVPSFAPLLTSMTWMTSRGVPLLRGMSTSMSLAAL